MQFTELSDEQVNSMQFAGGRGRGGKDPYAGLLEAVGAGKAVLVRLEEGMQMRNLKWRLSQAAKRSGTKLDIRVLADQSGVVVSLPAEAPPPPAGEPDPGAPARGNPVPQIIPEASGNACHWLHLLEGRYAGSGYARTQPDWTLRPDVRYDWELTGGAPSGDAPPGAR